MEAAVQRIWAQCLGVESIDRNADFFDVGGDSLVAISVAMTASHQGLDLTPQDLYDHPTVASLAKALVARYAAGGLARQSVDATAPLPVPPNIAYFLDAGVRERGRWRIPLILRIGPDVDVDDVRAVLTAVINHHDALRMRIEQRAGTWEQYIGDPLQSADLATASLPEEVSPGTSEEREAVMAILENQIHEQELSGSPLTATYVRGVPGGQCLLALSLHAMVGDNASREILLTDIFTAFGQRLAGSEITLESVPTPWREWSERCAALATHPAVLDSRDHWLTVAQSATRQVAGAAPSEPPGTADFVRLPSSLTAEATGEIDDARRRLRLPLEEILLAALSRTLAATIGDGVVAVDLQGAGRSVLKPDVDLRRTVGWFSTVYPIALDCNTHTGVTQLLNDVHDTCSAVPHYGIGYGLLRYLYAPTARLLGAERSADIFVDYAGTIPDLPALSAEDAPVQLDADTAMSVREATPGLGHAVELRVYRSAGVQHLDWWYDARRVEPAAAQSLADGFSAALTDLVRQAVAEDDLDSSSDELALVDLS
jgi:phthiocerol/phenolphthiocerol synthesis type-I polyketide synthase E